MNNVLWIIAIIFFILSILIKVFNLSFFNALYNEKLKLIQLHYIKKQGSKESSSEGIKKASSMLSKMCIILGALFIIGALVRPYFKYTYFLLEILTVSIITFTLIYIQRFNPNEKSRSEGTITAIIFFITLVLLIIPLFLTTISSCKVEIKNNNLIISGGFGRSFPIKEITSVQIVPSVPALGARSNGVSLGAIKKGEYRVKNSEDTILLYLETNKGPYIKICTPEDTVYMAFNDTNKIYDLKKTITSNKTINNK